MKRILKKLGRFLMLWDGLWSVPLLGLTFIALGLMLQVLFGSGVATYDPGVIQSALLSMFVVVAFTFATLLGLRFNFNTLYRWYLDESKTDFLNLKPWQRIVFFLFVFCLLYCSFLVVLSLVL